MVSDEELKRRVKNGEYIIIPKKPTKEMTQHEALEWERDCLLARLRINKDMKRKKGYRMRIDEIERRFRLEKAQQAYDEVLKDDVIFENEQEPEKDEDNTFFVNEMSLDDDDDDEGSLYVNEVEGDDNSDIEEDSSDDISTEDIEQEIEDDILFED